MVATAASRMRLAGVVAALVVAPVSASAQPQPAGPVAPGWLGVTLGQRFECTWEAPEEWKACSLVMHIQGLQEEGPARIGGLELGDRLHAIDGEEITYDNWQRLLGAIRPGTPVSVDVIRDGERHFAHVVPAPRPRDPSSLAWVRRPESAPAANREPRAFVFRLTEPRDRDGAAIAITVRDVENGLVDVSPAAVRVIDGQLRLTPLDEKVFSEFPELRSELLGDLSGISESTYRRATSALEVFDRIGERLQRPEFQRRLASVAKVGLAQPELAIRFTRSFGGAEFEPVRQDDRAGLLVLRVVPRTAAARAGLRSGDLVVRAGDEPTREVSDLVRALNEGDRLASVDLTWIRDGREMRRPWPRR
ncbi:MAG: PDZ domain-containing protein [Gemmatimonadota bacterium]|nr:PDZ domain-containing protein [Gemmatimonadota bacterium]